MELNTNYWTLMLANGGVISLLGMAIYFLGLGLLIWKPLQQKQYELATLVTAVYTLTWFALGIWWTTN
jgi:hypothetical protein